MAGFSIVTNINSLIAQENLGKTNIAQQRTIQRLTSGLRINSSADDAPSGSPDGLFFRLALLELLE